MLYKLVLIENGKLFYMLKSLQSRERSRGLLHIYFGKTKLEKLGANGPAVVYDMKTRAFFWVAYLIAKVSVM